MPEPTWFNSVGPVPFRHVRDVSREGWREEVRRHPARELERPQPPRADRDAHRGRPPAPPARRRGRSRREQSLARKLDIGLFFREIQGLGKQIRDDRRLAEVREKVWRQRELFTFDRHADDLLALFRAAIDKRSGSTRAAVRIGRVARLAIGDPAPYFELPGVDGKTHGLRDYEGRPVAVIFSCCHCPYVIAWEDRINEVARDYADRAGLVAINSNHYLGDSFEDMQERAAEKGFVFPFLRDESQDVAAAYGAARTPEAFVFDRSHRLVYHGAPDSDHTNPTRAEPYLRRALDAALEGGAATPAETPPVGCTVKWRR